MQTDYTQHSDRTIAWRAGREAAESKIPITQSALVNLAVGCQQYMDFIDGYDSLDAEGGAK